MPWVLGERTRIHLSFCRKRRPGVIRDAYLWKKLFLWVNEEHWHYRGIDARLYHFCSVVERVDGRMEVDGSRMLEVHKHSETHETVLYLAKQMTLGKLIFNDTTTTTTTTTFNISLDQITFFRVFKSRLNSLWWWLCFNLKILYFCCCWC